MALLSVTLNDSLAKCLFLGPMPLCSIDSEDLASKSRTLQTGEKTNISLKQKLEVRTPSQKG